MIKIKSQQKNDNDTIFTTSNLYDSKNIFKDIFYNFSTKYNILEDFILDIYNNKLGRIYKPIRSFSIEEEVFSKSIIPEGLNNPNLYDAGTNGLIRICRFNDVDIDNQDGFLLFDFSKEDLSGNIINYISIFIGQNFYNSDMTSKIVKLILNTFDRFLINKLADKNIPINKSKYDNYITINGNTVSDARFITDYYIELFRFINYACDRSVFKSYLEFKEKTGINLDIIDGIDNNIMENLFSSSRYLLEDNEIRINVYSDLINSIYCTLNK